MGWSYSSLIYYSLIPSPDFCCCRIVVLSVIIYPIGTPLLMLGLLLWFRIPHIAAQKRDQELLRALIAKFQASQPPAVARLAKYVGFSKTDASEGDEVSLKAQAAFDAIHQVTFKIFSCFYNSSLSFPSSQALSSKILIIVYQLMVHSCFNRVKLLHLYSFVFYVIGRYHTLIYFKFAAGLRRSKSLFSG